MYKTVYDILCDIEQHCIDRCRDKTCLLYLEYEDLLTTKEEPERDIYDVYDDMERCRFWKALDEYPIGCR